jgi:hypothetical protein
LLAWNREKTRQAQRTFQTLPSAALFISVGGSVGGIWTQANTRLTAANTAAASAEAAAQISGEEHVGLDAGDDAVTGPPDNLTTDQRSLPRLSGTHVDIGAYELAIAPKATSVVLNDGPGQRSMVTKAVITFDQHVTFTGSVSASFTILKNVGGASLGFTATASDAGSTTVVTLDAFTGSATDGKGSWIDGLYNLTINASTVLSSLTGHLDGNGDGFGGDNYVLTGSTGNSFFRFFGDSDGDGDVDGTDSTNFGNAFFPNYDAIFDWNHDSVVNNSDLSVVFLPKWQSARLVIDGSKSGRRWCASGEHHDGQASEVGGVGEAADRSGGHDAGRGDRGFVSA